MAKNNNFSRVLQTDYLKYRKSLVPWITLFYPFLTVSLITIIYFGMEEVPDRPLFDFSRNLLLVASFFLPFYLALLITQINFTENRIQGWKILYAQPVPKAFFFLSKISVIFICSLATLMLFLIFSIISAKSLGLYTPGSFISDLSNNFFPAFLKLLVVYLSASLMMAIQFFLSVRFRNFILPMGIGIAAAILPIAIFITLGIAGIIQGQGGLAKILRIDPYTLPYSFTFDFGALVNPDYLGVIPKFYVIGSVLLAIVVYILTYIDHTRRNTL